MDDATFQDYMAEAQEELKRIEHIIYVSLKYTRTTDVLKNALLRFVSFYDLVVEGLLIHAKEKELVTKIAKSPALRATNLVDLYEDNKEVKHYITFYFFLKDILKSEYERINEYRRHVGMVIQKNNSTTIINIDNLEACEDFAHDFFHFAATLLGMKKASEE